MRMIYFFFLVLTASESVGIISIIVWMSSSLGGLTILANPLFVVGSFDFESIGLVWMNSGVGGRLFLATVTFRLFSFCENDSEKKSFININLIIRIFYSILYGI